MTYAISPHHDVDGLSDRDLLAHLVGDIDADLLLARTGGSIFGVFALADPSIPRVPMVAGEAVTDRRTDKALRRLRVSHQLVRRVLCQQVQSRPLFDQPNVLKSYLKASLATLQHEVFMVLTLSGDNRLIASTEMFRGTLTQVAVYPREVVRLALCQSAAAVVLVHNHPSGSAEPSRSDELLTKSVQQALALVDVRVIDHIVVTASQCVSFAERGLL